MPGRAVRHRGPLAQSRVTRESSKTPRAIGYGPSRPGELVDTSGHLTRAQVSRECWWTPRALGPGSESHGTPGRRRGHSDPGPRRAGQLVDTVCPLTRAGIAQRSWSTPRALGPEPSRPRDVVDTPDPRARDEEPGTDGRHRGPAETSPRRRGTAGRPLRPLDQGRSRPGQLVNPVCPQTRRKSPGNAIRHCGTSGTVQSHLRCSLQPWALGNGPEYPGNAGRPEGPQTRSRVSRDSWATLRALRPWPESPGTVGRPRGASDQDLIQAGQLVDPGPL